MKKFVAMVLVTVLAVVYGAAIAENQPKIEMYDLDRMVWGDDYDLHISMWLGLPEYENAHVVMRFRFVDDPEHNYTEGVATLYDGNTGEFIDETTGWLAADIDASSMDVETVRKNLYEYATNYNFEADEEVRYGSIIF